MKNKKYFAVNTTWYVSETIYVEAKSAKHAEKIVKENGFGSNEEIGTVPGNFQGLHNIEDVEEVTGKQLKELSDLFPIVKKSIEGVQI